MATPGIGLGLRRRQTSREDIGGGRIKKTKEVMNLRTGAMKTKEVIKNPSRPFGRKQTTTTVTKKGYCDDNNCYKVTPYDSCSTNQTKINNKCYNNCSTGYTMNPNTGACVQNCPTGYNINFNDNKCYRMS